MSYCQAVQNQLRFIVNKERRPPMNMEKNDEVFVRVKDMAGNEFVCPLNELRNVKNISEEELEDCFEGDVVGRYAGQLNIVESGD